MTAPQDKAQMDHLRQVCQEQDGRIQQLEQELDKARLELKNTTEKYRELSQRETKSVACSTEDLPTNEERVERAASAYGFVDAGLQGGRTMSSYGFVNGSLEGPLPKGPHSQSAENFGPQNNEYGPPTKKMPPDGPSRIQIPSVPGSPARRHVIFQRKLARCIGKRVCTGLPASSHIT